MPDYALLTIPAFWLLALHPHFYSMHLLLSHNNKAYSNVAPRSASNAETYQKTLPPKEYQKFIRARGAHTNGNETWPVFAIAVLAGRYAGIDVDTFAYANLALRLLYNILYINTADLKLSYIRTLVWIAQVGSSLAVMGLAGWKTGN